MEVQKQTDTDTCLRTNKDEKIIQETITNKQNKTKIAFNSINVMVSKIFINMHSSDDLNKTEFNSIKSTVFKHHHNIVCTLLKLCCPTFEQRG